METTATRLRSTLDPMILRGLFLADALERFPSLLACDAERMLWGHVERALERGFERMEGGP